MSVPGDVRYIKQKNGGKLVAESQSSDIIVLSKHQIYIMIVEIYWKPNESNDK